MGDGDGAGGQPAQQSADRGRVEPDDDAVGSGGAHQPGSQRSEVDGADEETVEIIGEPAPFADPGAQEPLRRASWTVVGLRHTGTLATRWPALAVDPGQQPC